MAAPGSWIDRLPLPASLARLLTNTSAIPEQYVDRVRVVHIDSWARQSFVMVPAGILVALALVFQYPHALRHLMFMFCLAALVLAYVANLIIAERWLTSANKIAVMPAVRQWLFAARLTLGIIWAIYLNLMIRSGGPGVETLIVGVEVALISSAVIGGPMTYAFSVWLPVTIGSLVSVTFDSPAFSPAVVVCVVIYALYTLYSILALNARMVERTLTTIRLEQTNETIRILLRDFEESASDWLWETDTQLCLRHVSPRFAEVARQPVEAMQGKLVDLLRGEEPIDPTSGRRQLLTLLEQRMPLRDIVVPVQIGPECRWWSLTGKPIFEGPNGEFSGYRGVGSDVTASHRSSEHIAFLARHDTLTGLANRVEFNAALAAILRPEHSGRTALLSLDLDAFKAVNDSYGHAMGDNVLRAVAHRIRATIRDRDLAARLGGDEFSLLLNADDEVEVTAIARRLVDRLARPFKFDGVTIEIGASIGIAMAPRDGTTPEELYKNADLALYRAKAAGRGTWRFFDIGMDRNLQDHRALQRDLRDAVANDGLFVEFQPIIVLRSRAIIGVEALARWRHPERGLISPDIFVPIAEQIGLIGAIGSFVFGEAIALTSVLPAHCRISVNLSPVQLRDPKLIRDAVEQMNNALIDPKRIEFEITESAMLETDGRSLDNLRMLRQIGCRTAIDDFGAGYSSLATLRDFPFDRLKIDSGFIVDLETDSNKAPIVRAIIDLAHTLNLGVTAEGVENDLQAGLLEEYGCDEVQGYRFAAPLSRKQILDLPEFHEFKLGPAGATPRHMSAQHGQDFDRLKTARA